MSVVLGTGMPGCPVGPTSRLYSARHIHSPQNFCLIWFVGCQLYWCWDVNVELCRRTHCEKLSWFWSVKASRFLLSHSVVDPITFTCLTGTGGRRWTLVISWFFCHWLSSNIIPICLWNFPRLIRLKSEVLQWAIFCFRCNFLPCYSTASFLFKVSSRSTYRAISLNHVNAFPLLFVHLC